MKITCKITMDTEEQHIVFYKSKKIPGYLISILFACASLFCNTRHVTIASVNVNAGIVIVLEAMHIIP